MGIGPLVFVLKQLILTTTYKENSLVFILWLNFFKQNKSIFFVIPIRINRFINDFIFTTSKQYYFRLFLWKYWHNGTYSTATYMNRKVLYCNVQCNTCTDFLFGRIFVLVNRYLSTISMLRFQVFYASRSKLFLWWQGK